MHAQDGSVGLDSTPLLDSKSQSARARQILRVLKSSFRWFVNPLWPTAFYSMFCYDIHHYRNYKDKYQMDILGLLFGLPRNYDPEHAALSINLGGDIPAFKNFWLGTTLVITSPLMIFTTSLFTIKILSYLRNRDRPLKWLELDRLRRQLIAKEYRDPEEKRSHYQRIPSAKIRLGDVDPETERDFKAIAEIAESNGLYRLLAISALAQINGAHLFDETADEEKQDRIGKTAKDYLFGGDRIILRDARDVLNQDVEKLDSDPHTTIDQPPLATHLLLKKLAEFEVWYFDETKSLSRPVKWSYYFIWQFIPLARLMTLIVQKIFFGIQFAENQKDCENQGKQFSFFSELGNYDSKGTVCDYGDYRSAETGPGCLDFFTKQQHNASDTLTQLKILPPFGPYNDSSLDFSQHPWPTWPVSTWQEIMVLLPDFKYPSALNCSSQILSYFWVPPEMLSPIADYLKMAPVSSVHFKVDFSRQWINAQGMAVLVSGLQNNTRITELRLAQCGLSDSNIEILLPILPTMTTLTTLDLSGNALTGYTITLLNTILPNTTIVSLNLAGNELATAAIEQFEFDETPLQWLDISGTDLSQGAAINFAARTMKSQLIYLGLANCQIPDSQVMTMFPNISHSGIRTLDYSYNQISFDGMQIIAEYTPDSTITDLNLANNAFNDAALALLTFIIGTKNCPLTRLVLSGNQFTAAGLQDFILTLNTSALQTLELAHIQSGDDMAAAFTLVPAQSLPLVQLDLSWTKMTAQGAKQFLSYQINSSLTWLDLSHNSLAGDLSSALFSGLTAGKLQQFFLRATQVDKESIQAACQALPDSKLEVFDISENNLGDSVAINCSKNFITPYEDFWFGSLAQNYDKSRVVTHSKRHTQMRRFIFQQDQSITVLGAEALCSVAPAAQIQNQDLLVSSSAPGNMSTGVRGCPISGNFPVWTSSAQSEYSTSWLLIAMMMLLVLRNNPVLMIIDAVSQGLQKTTAGVVKGCANVRQLSAACRKTGMYSGEAKTMVKTESFVSAGRYQL